MRIAFMFRFLRDCLEPQLLLRLVGSKILYLGAIFLAVWVWNDLDMQGFQTIQVRWPREGNPVYASHFATWDAAHYLYLSDLGYRHEVESCAFYPLWPLLLRWFSRLSGVSHLWAGLLLANVFSLAAWVLFHRLVASRWGATAANWSLVFLIAFPGSLFFQFIYTESLFLLLVLLLWWSLEQRRYGWAWLAGGLLPLTRGVGVFVLLPIAWHAVQPAWRRWRATFPVFEQSGFAAGAHSQSDGRGLGVLAGRRGAWEGLVSSIAAQPLWLLTAPVIGWVVYLMLMWNWTGHPFEGFEAQKSWGVHSITNLWNVPKFLVGLVTPYRWHGYRGSALDRVAFLLIAGSLPMLWRLDKSLLVWLYVLGILPAMSGTFTSFTRFASCAFPMFIAIGVFVGRREWRGPGYALLAMFAIVHIVLLWCFVNFRWAG